MSLVAEVLLCVAVAAWGPVRKGVAVFRGLWATVAKAADILGSFPVLLPFKRVQSS